MLVSSKPKAPVIDLSLESSNLSESILKACKEFGFFQVQNHGVSENIISRVEKQGHQFFSKSAIEKQKAVSPAPPFGYGCKNIGFNGDHGHLEYILLQANPDPVSHTSESISADDPQKFSSAVNDYIEAVRNLACEILDIVSRGLLLHDNSVFSNLIRAQNNDSCFRINHYPSLDANLNPISPDLDPKTRIGFGEHSDPQILTILWSNNVGGLQILSADGLWVPIDPDSEKLCVFVGDALHALSNGEFVNVRHRAVAANSGKSRMSIIYFAAPSLSACISPIPELVSIHNPSLYKPFTWGDYKNTFYSLRLADDRLNYFRNKHV